LRIYKQKKPPAPAKKPEVREPQKKSVAMSPKPTPRPSLTAQQPFLPFYPQFPPFMSEQDLMNAYMMMCFTNPWYGYPPYQ
jgi:hypothetical protein